MKRALVIVGHGSREKGFNTAMKRVARVFQKDKRFHSVLCAYNEIVSPSLPDAVEVLAKKGTQKIFVLTYFLQAGRHVKRDIPKMIAELRKKHSRRVRFILCDYLGYDTRIVGVVRDRLKRA